MAIFAPVNEISVPEVADRDEVAALVRDHVLPTVPADCAIVSVDGLNGAGKSAVARALASLSGRTLIELDQFLERNQDGYLGALHLDDLASVFTQEDTVVIEGCLVEAVLQRVGRRANFRIYVARTARMLTSPENEWCDESELLLGSGPAIELIRDEERELQAFCQSGLFGMEASDGHLSGLRRELIEYHRAFEPQRRANMIVKVTREI